MRQKLLLIILTALISFPLFSEDYQYQYFREKKEHVPFSDYIPRSRLHYKTVPHYLEDFYELYGMKQYYNENSLRKNINRMKIALTCKFRHPSEALVKIETEDEYTKYRRVMFMHINLLIMRNYMRIASRYDKQHIRFYNAEFADDIKKSLDIAEKTYREALPYWEEAKKNARSASSIKITTGLSFMESERYSIIHNELDYGKIIDGHVRKLSDKKKKLDDFQATRK